MEAKDRKKPGRKATGLVNSVLINFMWDETGREMVRDKAKAHGLSRAAYHRMLVLRDVVT